MISNNAFISKNSKCRECQSFPMLCFITLLTLNLMFIGDSQNYILQQEIATFTGSENLCLFNYDSHLASIHDDTQYSESVVTASGNQTWIGLNDKVTEGTWIYTDGTSFDYGTTQSVPPWDQEEPNDFHLGEDCIFMLPTISLWNDGPCDDKKYALCDYPQAVEIINDPSHYVRMPSIGNFIGFIDIMDEIYISFDIIFNSWSSNDHYYTNHTILYFGNSQNEKYPAIYLENINTNKSKTLVSVLSVINEEKHIFDNEIGLKLHESYKYILHQTQNHMKIQLDDVDVYDGNISSHSILMNRAMYLGNPWNTNSSQLLDIMINNLYVTTSNSHSPNVFNYNCQGSNRWNIITGSWVLDDIACTIKATDDTEYPTVIWLGDDDISSINWTDYKIEVKFQIHSGQHAGILVRCISVSSNNNGGQQYWFGAHKNDQILVMGKFDDSWTSLHSESIAIDYNTEYIMRIEITGNRFDAYWNNEFVFTQNDSNFAFGSVGLRTAYASATYSSVRIMFVTDGYLLTVPPTSQTSFPTTSQPTYLHTTSMPTTSNPTTSNPTTFEPTTLVPTSIPSTSTPTETMPTKIVTWNPTQSKKEGEIQEGTKMRTTVEVVDMDVMERDSDIQYLLIMVIIGVICIIMIILSLVYTYFYFRYKKRADSAPNSIEFASDTSSNIKRVLSYSHGNNNAKEDHLESNDDDIINGIETFGNIEVKGENDEAHDDCMNDMDTDIMNDINLTVGNDEFVVDGNVTDDMIVSYGVTAMCEDDDKDEIIINKITLENNDEEVIGDDVNTFGGF